MTREDIEFPGECGVTLRGWFYPADGDTTSGATVVMAHGLSSVKEMYLDEYARVFSQAGLNVVVYDHRNFGSSDGTPRQEVDPVLQYRDYRNAITFAGTRPEVDGARIGIWGSSFSGGHVLTVASIDRRVKAVVAQVPFVSGSGVLQRAVRPDFIPHTRALFDADRLQRFDGGEPTMVPVITPDPTSLAVMPSTDAHEWFAQTWRRAPAWRNEITARSMELVTEYEPTSYISGIAPTPLLMIVAADDAVAPVALALEAFERAREPKRIIVAPGGHFDLYAGPGFDLCAAAACIHFREHL